MPEKATQRTQFQKKSTCRPGNGDGFFSSIKKRKDWWERKKKEKRQKSRGSFYKPAVRGLFHYFEGN